MVDIDFIPEVLGRGALMARNANTHTHVTPTFRKAVDPAPDLFQVVSFKPF